MKALITGAEKQVLPRYNAELGRDEDTLMVVVGVDFVLDSGELHSHQSYGVLPEVLGEDPLAYFQSQADVLQGDLDQRVANAGKEQSSKQADVAIAKLLVNTL